MWPLLLFCNLHPKMSSQTQETAGQSGPEEAWERNPRPFWMAPLGESSRVSEAAHWESRVGPCKSPKSQRRPPWDSLADELLTWSRPHM